MNPENVAHAQSRSPSWFAGSALAFACLLSIAWVGAWVLEQSIELRGVWLVTDGGRFVYWLIMKAVLWVVPSIVLIHLSGRSLRSVAGLERGRAIILWGGGVGIVLGAITVSTKLFGHQPLFSSPLGWSVFSGVIVSPIVEEITFRGAILGTLERRFSFWMANAISGLLFLGIHLPGWYFQGCLFANLRSPVGGALSILLLGLFFGYVAHRSKSVAASTVTHMLNNLFNT